MQKVFFLMSICATFHLFGQTNVDESRVDDNVVLANMEYSSYSGSIYFKYDVSGSSRPSEKLYIHYGSNASYVTSTTPGSSATVKCQEGAVYYSFTGKKSDMVKIMDVAEEDCGKTFKYSQFK